MVAGPRASSQSKQDIIELSDADPFTVAPFVEHFCLEFQKFNQETTQHIVDTATSFNGKALVDNVFQEINKLHQHASDHATEAVNNSKAVMEKIQSDLDIINREAAKQTQSHGKAMVEKVQTGIEKFQCHASNVATMLSTIMSNSALLVLNPRRQDPAAEMDVDDSRDPSETTTSARHEAGGESEQIKEQIEAEIERIKVQVTTITLTTEANTKVYATKSFLDGDFAENPNLWKVDFYKEWAEPQPLPELEKMEIHIGGNFFTRINNENVEGYLEENKQGEVALCIDDLVWVTLSLSGYQVSDMERLKTVGSNKVLGALLALTSKSIRFHVEDVQFFSPSIPGLMSFVAMDQEGEKERQKELKAHALLGEIILIMQRNGGGDDMKELVARGSEILDALSEDSSEHSALDIERLETIVPLMMAAQKVGVQKMAEVARISKGRV